MSTLSGIITPSNVLTSTSTNTVTNKTINIANNTLTGVQPTLVSGTNIKTINGGSVLGSGDLAVGGGSMIFLSEVTVSSSVYAYVENTFNSTYDEYVILVSGLKPSIAGAGLQLIAKIGGSYVTSGYYYQANIPNSLGATGSIANSNVNLLYLTNSFVQGSFGVHIHSPSSTSLRKSFNWYGVAYNTDDSTTSITGAGDNTSTSALTGIRFNASTGTLLSGTFRLYGIKKI